jgi:hypothetical protein
VADSASSLVQFPHLRIKGNTPRQEIQPAENQRNYNYDSIFSNRHSDEEIVSAVEIKLDTVAINQFF